LPPIALLSSLPSAPPSSPLVLVLVDVINEVTVSGVANRFNVVSSSLSLSVTTSPPGDKDDDKDVMQRRCRPQQCNSGAKTSNAIAASWRPRSSGLPNPRRKSTRAAFLPFTSRLLAGWPSSSSPPLSTLRPAPALLNARLQCGRPHVGRRRRRPSNNNALPPAPHRCTTAAVPTMLHSHSPARRHPSDAPPPTLRASESVRGRPKAASSFI
jgi:hypothetical protein